VKVNVIVILDDFFTIQLEDYNVKIPKIVMYKIAEEIDVSIKAKLKEI
jgi:hypothetical protein